MSIDRSTIPEDRRGAVDAHDHAAEIARLVGEHPAVIRLSAGVAGEVATYGRGTRIRGVRVRDDRILVQVVVRPVGSLIALGEELRHLVLARHPEAGRVDVVIADVDFDADLDLVASDPDAGLSPARMGRGPTFEASAPPGAPAPPEAPEAPAPPEATGGTT